MVNASKASSQADNSYSVWEQKCQYHYVILYSDDKETEQNAVLVLAASTSAFQAESTSSNLVYCSKDQKGLINVWVITPPVLVKKHCANTKRLCFSASLEFFRPLYLGV